MLVEFSSVTKFRRGSSRRNWRGVSVGGVPLSNLSYGGPGGHAIPTLAMRACSGTGVQVGIGGVPFRTVTQSGHGGSTFGAIDIACHSNGVQSSANYRTLSNDGYGLNSAVQGTLLPASLDSIGQRLGQFHQMSNYGTVPVNYHPGGK